MNRQKNSVFLLIPLTSFLSLNIKNRIFVLNL